MRPFLLAALIGLLSAPAYSHAPGQNSQSPGLNLSGLGEKTRSPAEKQRDQEVDQAYSPLPTRPLTEMPRSTPGMPCAALDLD
jgi:hypothetical protein